MTESPEFKRVTIIQGHPDAAPNHFGHALADAYGSAAAVSGHAVRRITVANLTFPLLRSRDEWEKGAVPESLKAAQEDIAWANHLVLFYPLWLGDVPALVKGFLEQVARPGFALQMPGPGRPARKLLKGRSARIVVTMGMPGFFYRWFYRAHSLKSLERNILNFVGIGPVKDTVIGLVEGSAEKRRGWLEKMTRLGRAAV